TIPERLSFVARAAGLFARGKSHGRGHGRAKRRQGIPRDAGEAMGRGIKERGAALLYRVRRLFGPRTISRPWAKVGQRIDGAFRVRIRRGMIFPG
ncbi:MAG: hypothetical protein ACFNUI_08370, partial [Negativicutes bacterium]